MAMPPVNALNTLANKKSESHVIDGQVYLRYGSAVRGCSVFYHLNLEATFNLMYANNPKLIS
ncbi:hypothetical protein MNBD_GAMMA09-489 [hydrothermal vent metagenome]|uniref:Uncharacterized protein n=1 Tax=hydrothermal vent metagenome TaxID=652676 RepID=A0A3B0XXX8_9ZZZZ